MVRCVGLDTFIIKSSCHIVSSLSLLRTKHTFQVVMDDVITYRVVVVPHSHAKFCVRTVRRLYIGTLQFFMTLDSQMHYAQSTRYTPSPGCVHHTVMQQTSRRASMNIHNL